MAASDMDALASRFADRGVTSTFIYTREAHPAEVYRHHTSMAVKRENAKSFQNYSNLSRRVLIDDLEGTAHHAYGLLPNMTFIIARNKILYKAAWTMVDDIASALEQALDFVARQRDDRLLGVYSERLAFRPDRPEEFRKGLLRNGAQAVTDFYGPEKKSS